MEEEEGAVASSAPVEVTGTVIHFNKGAAFFRFQEAGGVMATCLFRPNRLLVAGRRLTTGQLKTAAAIGQFLAVGDTVTGLITPRVGARPYVVNTDNKEQLTIEPAWYAEHIWKGEKPAEMLSKEVKAGGGEVVSPKMEQEVILDNVTGRIILNQLASGTGRGGAGQTIISFRNPNGNLDAAMFRNPRCFYMDGERVQPRVYKRWPKNYEINVSFTAIYTPGLKELEVAKSGSSSSTSAASTSGGVKKEKEEEEEETTTLKVKPNWRARLVWTGTRPSEERIKADEDQASEEQLQQKSGKQNGVEDFMAAAMSSMECLHGRLDRILTNSNNNCGIILAAGDQRILFSADSFTVDGQHLAAGETLRQALVEGDLLSCYARSLDESLTVEGHEVSYQASQVWKVRRPAGTRDENPTSPAKKKASFPPPGEATHLSLAGHVVELATAGVGYLEISEGKLAGERVLFSRNRLCIHGNRLRYRESLADHLALGDEIRFDMVRAAAQNRRGEAAGAGAKSYDWIALLAWVGCEPDRTEISEVFRKLETYRAKVITLDEWSREAGCTGGIIQVTGGSGRIGERAVFGRENTYVFGVRMNRADLAHILRLGDKVQMELQNLPQPVVRCGVEIRHRASLVYIGPSPKLDDPAPEDPSHQLSSTVTPFLTKRGLTEQEFLSLVRGQLPPKAVPPLPPPGSMLSAGGGGGTESAGTATTLPVILPPATIYGRVIELRKPENPTAGSEHGLFQIENGPFQQERAFFNRNCLFCWGYNCAKADLMYLITEHDRFCVEVQDGTNNKAVQFKVTAAWVGPHPNDRNRKAGAMVDNPIFSKWLREHSLTLDKFLSVVEGRAPPLPFFPVLPADQQLPARLAYFLPPRFTGRGGGADAGILRLCQTHPNSKDGRKAPEVLFERDSLYIWNVPITSGDLRYVINENDKVFVEVTDLLGKEKKKWQSRLGSQNIPKFIASLVYIGGGRPKQGKISGSVADNNNLVPWLKKRGLDARMFERLLNGELMPKPVAATTTAEEDIFSQAYPAAAGHHRAEDSLFSNPAKASAATTLAGNLPYAQQPAAAITAAACGGGGVRVSVSGGSPLTANNSFQAAVLNKALKLTQKTMSLQTPEDPEVRLLIQDDSEAQLALFLSKTLTNAIMMYRQMPGSVWPPGNPGPIGPPRRGIGGGGRTGGGGAGSELNEFYADSGLVHGGCPDLRGGGGSGGGLYGLSHPLLEYNGGGSPLGGQHGSLEPPYKRKFEDW